jgi:hypothetical protein
MSRTSAGVARRRALVVALLGAALGCVLLATVLLDLSVGTLLAQPRRPRRLPVVCAFICVRRSTRRSPV